MTNRLRVITKDGNSKQTNEYFQANQNRIGINKGMDSTLYNQIDTFGRAIAGLKTDTYVDTIIELNISMNEELG